MTSLIKLVSMEATSGTTFCTICTARVVKNSSHRSAGDKQAL